MKLGNIREWIGILEDDPDAFGWPSLLMETVSKGSDLENLEVELSRLFVTSKGYLSFNVMVKNQEDVNPNFLDGLDFFQSSVGVGIGVGIAYPASRSLRTDEIHVKDIK